MNKTDMNPIFSLKNFRSFGEDGADFELAPITVLTGCNSAGKSSLVKSMLLLAKQSHQNLPEPIQVDRGYLVEEPIGGDLPVADKEFCLGNIHKVMNRHSGGGYIEFSYVIFSQILQDYVRVIKRFRPAGTKFMIYGALSYVKIEKTNGNLLAEFSENSNIIAHLTKALHKIASPVKDILGDSYMNFCNEVLRKVSFLSNISYIDSPSAIIKRIYSVEDDDRLSKAIRKLYERGRAYTEYLNRGGSAQGCIMPTSFVNSWIKKYEIGDKIDIEMDDKEGLGAYVSLYKGNETSLLADEGYGISQLFTLLLQIDNNLPNIERHSYEPRWICVEEPEVHLHPKYQSLLADLFVEAYQKYNIHFIIETHSEYLIRRLQVMVADKKCALQPNDISLNFINKDDSGISHNRQIKIHEDGGLNASLFGEGFFDESNNLAKDLFRLKPILS